MEKAKEEAAQSREQAVSAKKAVVKAREEAARYKGEAVDLDNGAEARRVGPSRRPMQLCRAK